MPKLADVQPPPEKIKAVHTRAIDEAGELTRIAKFVHSEPNPEKDPEAEMLYYLYAPLLLEKELEIWLVRLEVGGKDGSNSKTFRNLQVGLLDVEFIPLK